MSGLLLLFVVVAVVWWFLFVFIYPARARAVSGRRNGKSKNRSQGGK